MGEGVLPHWRRNHPARIGNAVKRVAKAVAKPLPPAAGRTGAIHGSYVAKNIKAALRPSDSTGRPRHLTKAGRARLNRRKRDKNALFSSLKRIFREYAGYRRANALVSRQPDTLSSGHSSAGKDRQKGF